MTTTCQKIKGNIMDRSVVASSNLRAVGYDSHSQTLEVEFISGSVYQYYGVPEQIHVEIMQASSKGKFFNYYIKNMYPYSRVA